MNRIEGLNQNEILRYLGYRDSGVTQKIQKLLDMCVKETLRLIEPKYTYRRFQISERAEGILVEGTDMILKGKDIREHLKGCQEVFFLGVTVGILLDRRIRRAMICEPDAGIVLDSCGIQAVEQAADLAEQEIRSMVSAESRYVTWRFSPGYGDFPLETQREIVRVLDLSRKIGVSLTESCMMVPGKSVTAVLGVCDTKKEKIENSCDFCNNKEECLFRKRGTRC